MSGNTIKVKPEQLAAAIRKELESYSKAATEETKELIRETAKICKEEIQSASPVRTGKYRKGWSIKPLWEDNDSLREIVRNRSAWQLTHLLENGHAKPYAIIMTPMLLWEMATRPSSTLSKRAKVSPCIAEKRR